MDEAHHSHQDSLHGVNQRHDDVASIRRRDKDKQDNQGYPYPSVLLHGVWLTGFEPVRLLVPNQVLYQTKLQPVVAASRTRSGDRHCDPYPPCSGDRAPSGTVPGTARS